MKVVAVLLVTFTVSLMPCISSADDDDSTGTTSVSVQNRKHTMKTEFSGWIGTLPLDAFEKGLTFTGAFTFHFNNVVAWEVGQFTYSHAIDAKLKAELDNISIEPTQFEVVRYFATTGLMLKPIYGKMSFLNRALFYGEIFFTFGGGFGQLTNERRAVAHAGAGLRIYAGKHASFRLDIRDYMFLRTDDVLNELWIALGICLSFG